MAFGSEIWSWDGNGIGGKGLSVREFFGRKSYRIYDFAIVEQLTKFLNF